MLHGPGGEYIGWKTIAIQLLQPILCVGTQVSFLPRAARFCFVFVTDENVCDFHIIFFISTCGAFPQWPNLGWYLTQ